MKHTESTSRKGDLAEYYAVTWLWDNGYEVFQNAGCSGPVDMIAMDNKGEIILIDVKTGKTGHLISGNARTEHQIKLGVKFLLFSPNSRELRFVKHEKIKLHENNQEEKLD